MILLGGSASNDLSKEIAKLLDCEYLESRINEFPDGERLITIDHDLEKEDVIIVQSTFRPQDSNLMELFFLLDALKDWRCRTTVLVPYFGYGRQDRSFHSGETVSSRAIARHLSLDSDLFITINPHKEYILDHFTCKALNLDAAPLIGKYFSAKDLSCPVVVAPDAGSKNMAQRVGDMLDCRIENCNKKRLGPGKVITSAEGVELEGEDVIIVDDIIDSGGTIVEAAKALKDQGAGPIHVACIHPVLTANAAERILNVAEELVATNTIETPYSKISVAGLIADAVKKG